MFFGLVEKTDVAVENFRPDVTVPDETDDLYATGAVGTLEHT